MSDRQLLGDADVSQVELTRMVADLLGHPRDAVEVIASSVSVVDYELDALTTAGALLGVQHRKRHRRALSSTACS